MSRRPITRVASVCGSILKRIGRHPVLVDVGSAGGAPGIWTEIAPESIYIAFDADPGAEHDASAPFARAVIMNKAITPDTHVSQVPLFLTRYPHCSSVLPPDTASLSQFLFASLFNVERTATVPATSLDTVLPDLRVHRIDWLKVDSQGTDLRIFGSINPEVRSRILALDVEPGLIDAYCGEDMFVDTHHDLVRQGFWLSNLSLGRAVRVRRETVHFVATRYDDITPDVLERAVKGTPAWAEARYLRTIEWLTDHRLASGDFAMLWVFAVLDGQLGFALDIAGSYRRLFGSDSVAAALEDLAVGLIRDRSRRSRAGTTWRTARRLISRITAHLPA